MKDKEDLEKELRIYKNRLENAMEHGNIAWWEMELPSGEVDFNERKAKMLGYSPEKFTHYTDFTDLLHPEDHDRAMKAMRNHLEGRAGRYEVEYRIKKKDGSYKWFRDVGGITEEDEDEEYKKITGIVIDIDERKKAEEREEFLHSLLRHDLRNKLQISLGYIGMLKDTDLSEEQEKFVGKDWKAKHEAIELIERVRKLREVSREGVEEVNLHSIVQSAVDKYEQKASQRGMEIDVEEFEHGVKGGSFLGELFSNLVLNSIVHSEGSELRIRTTETEGEVTVTVEDDGKGIPNEGKKKIFEKGYKKGENAGSGLGMYLVKEIAESYGGSVEVKDSELGGVRFDVHLSKA